MGDSVTRTMVIHVIRNGNFLVKVLINITGSLSITYVDKVKYVSYLTVCLYHVTYTFRVNLHSEVA